MNTSGDDVLQRLRVASPFGVPVGVVRRSVGEPQLELVVKVTFDLGVHTVATLAAQQQPLQVKPVAAAEPSASRQVAAEDPVLMAGSHAEVRLQGHARSPDPMQRLPFQLQVDGHALVGHALSETPAMFAAFQPRTLQLDALGGAERLTLQGLLAGGRRCEYTLPGLVPGVYLLHGQGSSRREGAQPQRLPMRCRALVVQCDVAQCWLGWRGVLSLPADAGEVRLAVGLGSGAPAAWTALEPLLAQASWMAVPCFDIAGDTDATAERSKGDAAEEGDRASRERQRVFTELVDLNELRAEVMPFLNVQAGALADLLPSRQEPAEADASPADTADASPADTADASPVDTTDASPADAADASPADASPAESPQRDRSAASLLNIEGVGRVRTHTTHVDPRATLMHVSTPFVESAAAMPFRDEPAPPAPGSAVAAPADDDGAADDPNNVTQAMVRQRTGTVLQRKVAAQSAALPFHQPGEEAATNAPPAQGRGLTERVPPSGAPPAPPAPNASVPGPPIAAPLPPAGAPGLPPTAAPAPPATIAESFAQVARAPVPFVPGPNPIEPGPYAPPHVGEPSPTAPFAGPSPAAPPPRPAAVAVEPVKVVAGAGEGAAAAPAAHEDELPLERYAAVKASVLDGVPLEVALATHEIEADRWRRAQRRLAFSIARESAAGRNATARALDDAIRAARQRAEPQPVSADMELYVAVRVELEAADEPAAVLAELGLTPERWRELRRAWTRRALADERVAQQIRVQLQAARRLLTQD